MRKKNKRFRLDKSNENKECIVLYKNWNWNQEKRKNQKSKIDTKGDQEVYHQNNDSGIKDWYIILEVWKAQEIIYEAHTKHGSHLKVEPTCKEILKAGYRWDNTLNNIRDFYFK